LDNYNLSIELIKEILSTQYYAVLSSTINGQPHSNLIAFSVTNYLKSLIFVTEQNTQKYKNIRENSQVCLLIDNRTNRPLDTSQSTAITLIGIAREEEKTDYFRHLYISKHPQLYKFFTNPDNALIVIRAKRYIVAGFKKTEHIIVEP
jgi:general stress protein 26